MVMVNCYIMPSKNLTFFSSHTRSAKSVRLLNRTLLFKKYLGKEKVTKVIPSYDNLFLATQQGEFILTGEKRIQDVVRAEQQVPDTRGLCERH